MDISAGMSDATRPGVSRSSSIYSVLSMPDRTRVLRILPKTGRADEEIVVELEEVTLGSMDYECLSYTWGGPKYEDVGDKWHGNHKTIVCNGFICDIRENLYDVLFQMREMSMLGPIWIDALCIDQENQQERQHQVGIMSGIYNGATSVVVWLGKADEHTAPAFRALERFKITPAEYDEDRTLGSRRYHAANFTDEEFESILCIMGQRRWFSRLWIIQEMILAREITFLCGQHVASFEAIWAGAISITHLHARSALNPKYRVNPFVTQARFAMQFFDVGNMRYDMSQDNYPLLDIGHNGLLYSEADATDPRDKVFGLIGISRCHDERLDETLVADYDLTVEEVFTKAARFGLLSRPNLENLSRAQRMEDKKFSNLPSWVSDLTLKLRNHLEWGTKHLAAAISVKQDIMDFDGNVLILAASLWDRVIEVGEPMDDIRASGSIQKFLNVFLEIESEYSVAKEPLPQAMRRTLISDGFSAHGNTMMRSMDEEYDVQAAFDRFLFRLVCFTLKTNLDRQRLDNKAARLALLEAFLNDPVAKLPEVMQFLGTSEHPGYAPLGASILNGARLCQLKISDFVDGVSLHHWMQCRTDPYAQSWWNRNINRAAFRTERGYVGLADKSTRVGDGVYLVEGAAVCYILRPIQDTELSSDRIQAGAEAKETQTEEKELLDPESLGRNYGNKGQSGNNGERQPHYKYEQKDGKKLRGMWLRKARGHTWDPQKRKYVRVGFEDEAIEEVANKGIGHLHITSSEASYEDGGSFTLAGEVYLHGIMHGEAFANSNKVVFKEVRIH